MNNNLPTTATGSITIRGMDDLARLSNMLAKSNFFSDSKDAAQCGVKILAGLELGIPAFASMTGIHIIKGKPSISANLMAAIVKRSGNYNYKIKEHTNAKCCIEFFERWGNEWQSLGLSEMTLAEAQQNGLTKEWDKETKQWKEKHNWKSFPKNMLFARALSNGVRWYCPDIFLGAPVHTPEELGVEVTEEGEVIEVNSVEPVELTQEQRIEAIASLLGEDVDGWLPEAGSKPSQSWTDGVIQDMAVMWAENEGYHRSHARNSYRKHVPEFLSRGMSEAMAIAAWMEHIKASVR